MNEPTVWNSILSALGMKMNHESLYAWFIKPITILGIDEGKIRLKILDPKVEEWILGNYRIFLEEALDEVMGPGFGFSFEIGPEVQKSEIRHPSNVWNSILSALGKNVKKMNHESLYDWFIKPITIPGIEEGKIRLKVSDPVVIEWILGNYRIFLEEALDEVMGPSFGFSFEIGQEAQKPEIRQQSKFSSKPETATRTETAAAAAPQPIQVESVRTTTRSVDTEQAVLPINQKYTFESFVVGSCNEFAHAAALAVADSPSKTYNPLYLYGGVGLGKTHLMCAIGHKIQGQNRHLRLAYISVEKFMNELINAIKQNQTMTFREKYRSIDVLLIDDIQFIASKDRTQEEFFHTFNELYDGQKQIVISSDCPPKEIPTLEERLHSRFEWGLIADIQPPDLETKVAILRKKAESEKLILPDNVAHFIASKIKSNVRELEGALVRLTAFSSLKGEPISLGLAQVALKNIVEEEVSIETIKKVVAEFYNLTVKDLENNSRANEILRPRQIAMYLCRILTKASFKQIGNAFGKKDHSTVMHSVDKISELIEKNDRFHRDINNLKDTCK